MTRLRPYEPERTASSPEALLDTVADALGLVPNVVRMMAGAPPVLEAFVGFRTALDKGSLTLALRERIALVVAEANRCDYCVAAHAALAEAAGISREEVLDSRHARSPERATDAALHFARRLIDTRGAVTDDDVARVRRAGFDDAALAEIVANVALHVFTNYFALVARPARDFPAVPALDPPSGPPTHTRRAPRSSRPAPRRTTHGSTRQ